MKYFLAVILIALIDLLLIRQIDQIAKESIAYEHQLLIKQAKVHFDDQVNTRKWNARYGGVYVYPLEGQKPNPYLRNNVIRDEHNQTLIKINPAWMTRQLSELAKIDGYHFRITSLNPLNPGNQPDDFESEALHHMLDTNQSSYFEFNDEEKVFRYMGALITQPACMPCHQHQGYRLGDIRGGISVNIDSTAHWNNHAMIMNRVFWQKLSVVIVSLIILALTVKLLRHQELLETAVQKRTREINRTKSLLQSVLDAELSLLAVTDEKGIIYVNQTFLDFFGYSSFERFEQNVDEIIDLFEYEPMNMSHRFTCEEWIRDLLNKGGDNPVHVMVRRGIEKHYFRPNAKVINVEDKNYFLIIFDEITDHVEETEVLKAIASTDALTGLANRSKFDQVLKQQVALSSTTSTPLSLVLLDIDFFKKVNDTYGHDQGDQVLCELAGVLTRNVRKGDLTARWGGEEFAVILQSSTLEDAVMLAEKLREKIAEYDFGVIGRQTISCGVAQYHQGEPIADFVKRVDNALYMAKNRGRNQTVSNP